MTPMISAAVMASYAQADHEDVMNYRRSSLYSLMVNHKDQHPSKADWTADEIFPPTDEMIDASALKAD